MHPILLPIVGVVAAATLYKVWKRKQEPKIKGNNLIKNLVYNTIKWCSSDHSGNKNWVNDFENIQKESNKVNKFFMINNIKDHHNYINNIFNVCQNLILNRKILYLKKSEEFKKMYKKEFDYISKTVKKL